jgi:hypothetical protein
VRGITAIAAETGGRGLTAINGGTGSGGGLGSSGGRPVRATPGIPGMAPATPAALDRGTGNGGGNSDGNGDAEPAAGV